MAPEDVDGITKTNTILIDDDKRSINNMLWYTMRMMYFRAKKILVSYSSDAVAYKICEKVVLNYEKRVSEGSNVCCRIPIELESK